jgi:hypothetical protein
LHEKDGRNECQDLGELCAKEWLWCVWGDDVEEVDDRGGEIDVDFAIGVGLLKKREKGSEVSCRRLGSVLFFEGRLDCLKHNSTLR